MYSFFGRDKRGEWEEKWDKIDRDFAHGSHGLFLNYPTNITCFLSSYLLLNIGLILLAYCLNTRMWCDETSHCVDGRIDSRVHKVLLIINQTLALLLLLLCIIYAPSEPLNLIRILLHSVLAVCRAAVIVLTSIFCCCFCYAVSGCFELSMMTLGEGKKRSETLFLLSNYPIVLVSQRDYGWETEK